MGNKLTTKIAKFTSVLITICKKLFSTVTIVRQILARVLKFGNIDDIN